MAQRFLGISRSRPALRWGSSGNGSRGFRDGARTRGYALFSCLAFGACGLAVVAGCANSPADELPTGGATTQDGGILAPPDSGRTPRSTGEIFAHSEGTLYRIDTTTRAVTAARTFEGCTYVADIALDADSRMYGSTASELWLIENNTARCTRIAGGTFPNSLSFVPAGTVKPDREALVGFQGSDYVEIHPATGAVTKVGEIGDGLKSSGDIVSAKGGKTFVTVKGKDCADCLAEIDPKNGALVRNWGPIGHADVFGLAFWGGELYAFTNAGQLLLLTLDAGSIAVKIMPLQNAPTKFWGAGSTTSAPITPVR